MHKVLVICGSVRPTRIGHDVARWVMEALPADSMLELELVDLADWPLPMDDEPGVPARDPYAHAHTQAWSRKVSEAAGFVFVTPQYNWGYPAPLKNALDHLYKEWARKPAVIVTYGFHGGGKCAAQLRQVLKGLRMRPVRTMPALTLPEALKGGAYRRCAGRIQAGESVHGTGIRPADIETSIRRRSEPRKDLAMVEQALAELMPARRSSAPRLSRNRPLTPRRQSRSPAWHGTSVVLETSSFL